MTTLQTAPSLTAEQVRAAVLASLARIAPEMDPDAIEPDVSFRDQLDIDSMDFLNFVIAMNQDLGVEIPEADYAKLNTLDNCIACLTARGV